MVKYHHKTAVEVQSSSPRKKIDTCFWPSDIIWGEMTYIETWEEFAKAAEKLYKTNPWKVSQFLSVRSMS